MKKRLHDALLLMRTCGNERIMFCATRKKHVISMYTTTSCGMLFAASSRCYFELNINSTSFHCTGRYKLNKLTSLPMCGFIAQLVEHRTGIAEVTGSNPVEALIFFRLLLSNCLNWKIYCDDHISTFIFHRRAKRWNF